MAFHLLKGKNPRKSEKLSTNALRESMGAIADFLALIGEVITGIIDFVITFVTDLVYIIQVIGSVLAQIPSFLTWFPAQLSTILVLGISIAAIFKIAGRS